MRLQIDDIITFRKPDLVKHCPDNLYDFVNKIGGTLKVDNEPFTFGHGHEYLIEPYKAVRFNGRQSDEGGGNVLMCGAQVGKTVFAMLAEVMMACYFWGKYFGYFFPDRDMAMITSGVRFKPLCLSIPEIAPIWGEDPTSDDKKTTKKTDAQRVRSIGPSQIFFSYMGGKTSTESIPMLGMVFDEVRRMLEGDVERATERMSHSPYPYDIKISTAGYPEATIDRYFRQSTQNKFHSRCKCPNGVVLSDFFPECIGEQSLITPKYANKGKYFWVCPTCGEPIDNPRDGYWQEHNPGAKKIGHHIPQILSPRQNAVKIYEAYLNATDLTEFYNSKLGIPHLSKEAQIVDIDILKSTVDTDLRWKSAGRNTALGIDQMLGFNVAVVREWGPKMDNGHRESRLIHLEWIAKPEELGFSPWPRCHELMKQYDVGFCVIDAMGGSAEQALTFALEYPGRVFLADYSCDGSNGEDICIWGDKVVTDPNRKASRDTKLKHRVMISRYHAIEWNLMRYVKRMKRQPHEKGLIGLLPDKQRKMMKDFVCDTFWKHLMSIARRKQVIDELQDKFKMVFENIGLDPHFLHADLYCELALTRIKELGNGAFGDYATAKPKETNHDFIQNEVNPSHYQCSKCGFAVAVPEGITPDEIAAKAGYKDCTG